MLETPSQPIKHLLFLSGTRADFGKLKPLMTEVERAAEFTCNIFATGMHTLNRYGRTLIEIEKSGFAHIYPYMNQMEHTSRDMDIVLASTIQGLSHYVREYRPDLIIVHGDRVEALAGAIVGALNNILVAHIEGGELSGTIDELIRHAISKMSHLHFVANEEARQRLIQMGEQKDVIYVIGSPDIDVMFSKTLPSLDEVTAYYEIPFAPYGIFMYHPVTTELDRLPQRIAAIVEALKASGQNFVVVYPNNDQGSEIILEAIKPLQALPQFRVFPSIRFEYFLVLLKHASVILGNSSAGIREAPAYQVPTINLGSRQHQRFSCPSIVNLEEDKDTILKALTNLSRLKKPSFYFGNGTSAHLFMQCLRQEKFWTTNCQKQFQSISLWESSLKHIDEGLNEQVQDVA
jgi:UDP-N-acetylglucosamine 2-epimerase (hydrolysing)